jgi:hemerythrin
VDHPRANWSAAIETGLPASDGQHKQLFALAATFRGEGDQIRIMRSLATLCDYANTHLADEEAMLEEIGYAKLPEHRLQHENFRCMLRQLLADSRKMTLDQIADRIEALINGWFYQHILTVDIEYVAAARAHRGPASSAAESTR